MSDEDDDPKPKNWCKIIKSEQCPWGWETCKEAKTCQLYPAYEV